MIHCDVLPDYEMLSRRAADWLFERLRDKPDALVCLAAGSTPKRAYELLAEHGNRELGLFARSRWIKLDEWGGLPMDDPATCEQQLRELLVTPLSLSDRYTAFNSNPVEPAAECRRISSWLKDNGPIDCCVLGLGINGHLGFNEPAEALQVHAHVAQLSDSSLSHSMLHASPRRPTFGLTLGMADLLTSRSILLLVSGKSKRGPLQRLMTESITTSFPASLLHAHREVTVLCDVAAHPQVT
jgi:galactosamine-6-phosphate isomerase